MNERLVIAAALLLLSGCRLLTKPVPTVNVEATVQARMKEEAIQKTKIARAVKGTLAAQATPSPTLPQPTVTAVVTNTPTQTSVPVSPPPTGWERFEGREVELYLPEGWVGGSDKALDAIIAELKKRGSNIAQMARQIEASRALLYFWAIDSKTIGTGGGVTNVNIVKNVVHWMSLEQFMDRVISESEQGFKNVGGTFKVSERKTGTLGNYQEVGWLVADETFGGIKMKMLQCIIKKGNTFWQITFTTSRGEFADYRPVFEKAFLTFKVIGH